MVGRRLRVWVISCPFFKEIKERGELAEIGRGVKQSMVVVVLFIFEGGGGRGA
jgi:hypothetical protein